MCLHVVPAGAPQDVLVLRRDDEAQQLGGQPKSATLQSSLCSDTPILTDVAMRSEQMHSCAVSVMQTPSHHCVPAQQYSDTAWMRQLAMQQYSDTAWMRQLAMQQQAVCLPGGRLSKGSNWLRGCSWKKVSSCSTHLYELEGSAMRCLRALYPVHNQQAAGRALQHACL